VCALTDFKVGMDRNVSRCVFDDVSHLLSLPRTARAWRTWWRALYRW